MAHRTLQFYLGPFGSDTTWIRIHRTRDMFLLDVTLQPIGPRCYEVAVLADICLHAMDGLHVGMVLCEILRHLRADGAKEGTAQLRHFPLLHEPNNFVVGRGVVRPHFGEILEGDVTEAANGVQCRRFSDVRWNAHKDYVLTELCFECLRGEFVDLAVVLLEVD